MQEEVRIPEFLTHFAKNTSSWLVKNQPLPPPNEKLAKVGTLGLNSQEYPTTSSPKYPQTNRWIPHRQHLVFVVFFMQNSLFK